MENEQMNPSYEQLAQAYSNLIRENEQLRMNLNAVSTDRLLERLKTVMQIVEHKESYSENIIKLAEWHIKEMLKKPKTK